MADSMRHQIARLHDWAMYGMTKDDCERVGSDQARMLDEVAHRIRLTIILRENNMLCAKCGKPKEPSRPNSKMCRRCDHGGIGEQ